MLPDLAAHEDSFRHRLELEIAEKERLAQAAWDTAARPFPWPPQSIRDLASLAAGLRLDTLLAAPFALQTMAGLAPAAIWASVRASGGGLTVRTPRFAAGDDVCCPVRIVERLYTWSAAAKTMRQRSSREVPGPTS